MGSNMVKGNTSCLTVLKELVYGRKAKEYVGKMKQIPQVHPKANEDDEF